MSERHIDTIEDVKFEVDEGGGFLTLEGDFVATCDLYLNGNFEEITLKLNRTEAEKLVRAIDPYLEP